MIQHLCKLLSEELSVDVSSVCSYYFFLNVFLWTICQWMYNKEINENDPEYKESIFLLLKNVGLLLPI